MPRERKAKIWVKMHCEGVLSGNINYLFLEKNYNENIDGKVVSLACQAVWLKMIAFSEICGGRAGFIEDNNRCGLPHQYIADELHCPIDLFENVR